MAKTETFSAGTLARSWLPPLDGGTAMMAVLIGFMGFYVLYPLLLIIVNSFNTATIAEPVRPLALSTSPPKTTGSHEYGGSGPGTQWSAVRNPWSCSRPSAGRPQGRSTRNPARENNSSSVGGSRRPGAALTGGHDATLLDQPATGFDSLRLFP